MFKFFIVCCIIFLNDSIKFKVNKIDFKKKKKSKM